MGERRRSTKTWALLTIMALFPIALLAAYAYDITSQSVRPRPLHALFRESLMRPGFREVDK